MTYKIERDGFFFRAVNIKTGWKSSAMTSASQVGMVIQRLAGKSAHRAAFEDFVANMKKGR